MVNARPAVGRSDLVRALVLGDEQNLSRLATLLAYEEKQGGAPGPTVALPVEVTLPLVEAAPGPPPLPEAAVQGLAPIPFWRLERVEHLEAEDRAERGDEVQPLNESEIGPLPGARRPAPPAITPWSRLSPALQRALRAQREGREVDLTRLIESWSRGEGVRRLPRRAALGSCSRVVVLVDLAARLAPLWRDHQALTRKLRRSLGKGVVEVFEQAEGEPATWRRGRRPPRPGPPSAGPGEVVLALSDLGFHGSELDRRRWARLGRALHRTGARVSALVGTPRSRWRAELAEQWGGIDWSAPLPTASRPRGGAAEVDLTARAEGLLRLLAPAVRVEPGLLREVRRLVPAAAADLGTELDAWSHPRVEATSSAALRIDAETVAAWRQGFSTEPPGLRAGVVRALRRWHSPLAREIWYEELLGIALTGALPAGAVEDEELERARRFAVRAGRTLMDRGATNTVFFEASLRWFRRFGRRLPAEAWTDPELAEHFGPAWAVAAEEDPDAPLPPGVLPRWLGVPGPPRRWVCRQQRRGLRLDDGTKSAPDGAPGSLLATLDAGAPVVMVAEGEGAWSRPLHLDRPERYRELAAGPELLLLSDRQELTFRRFERPEWASAAGRDRYGLWVEIEVKGITHRMRWIPPGRFWMGSPETEQGRWEDEGPRHQVTLTQGYWLGETPCTQAFWQAVMRKNPSGFKGEQRPVESVSWEDCQKFLAKLERLVPGCEPRLPTEAEWEHACRAGTETATWAGDLEISQGKAALLEAIAWYLANSGGETHPVGLKERNPWGLADMLGNVWEWCSDRWQEAYGPEPVIDPPGPAMGSSRVFRGGSWDSIAWVVRAAARDRFSPGVRYGDVGFRLARGQGHSGQGRSPGGGAGEPGSSGGGPAGDTEPPR